MMPKDYKIAIAISVSIFAGIALASWVFNVNMVSRLGTIGIILLIGLPIYIAGERRRRNKINEICDKCVNDLDNLAKYTADMCEYLDGKERIYFRHRDIRLIDVVRRNMELIMHNVNVATHYVAWEGTVSANVNEVDSIKFGEEKEG